MCTAIARSAILLVNPASRSTRDVFARDTAVLRTRVAPTRGAICPELPNSCSGAGNISVKLPFHFALHRRCVALLR